MLVLASETLVARIRRKEGFKELQLVSRELNEVLDLLKQLV